MTGSEYPTKPTNSASRSALQADDLPGMVLSVAAAQVEVRRDAVRVYLLFRGNAGVQSSAHLLEAVLID